MSSLSQPLLIVSYVLFIISTVVFIARLYTRCFHVKSVRIDDYIAVASWSLLLMQAILINLDINAGLGQHVSTIQNPANIERISLLSVIDKFPAIFAPYLARMSFSASLLLVLRRTRYTKTKIAVWVIVALGTLLNVLAILIVYVQCGNNGSELVKPTSKHAQFCINSNAEPIIGYVQSGLNSLSDFLLASMPFFLIRNFGLPKDIKRWSIGLCILGLVAFVASTIKAVQIEQLGNTKDFTYALAILFLTATIEGNMLFTLACLPSLRPLQEAKGPKLFSTQNGSANDFKSRQIDTKDSENGISAITKTVNVQIEREILPDEKVISQRILYGF